MSIIGVGATVLAISIALGLWNRASNAWAPVVEALRRQAWVHGKTVGPEGRELDEIWFSGREGVLAYKGPAQIGFLDHKLKVFATFVREQGVVHRRPEDRDRSGLPLSVCLYQQVLNPRASTATLFPASHTIRHSRIETDEKGRKWLELDLVFRAVEGSEDIQRWNLRVDPETNLPRSWRTLAKSGWSTTTFEYPETGPADIHALGVPRDAEIIDSVPGHDPQRIFAGLSAGRTRFDDYSGFVVGVGRNVHRIWKKGGRWRAERLLPGRKNWPPPIQADLSWWREHQRDFVFTTSAICDGANIHYYRMRDRVWSPDIKEPPPIRSNGSQPVSGPADDPIMPWPHLMPEQLGHPSIRLTGTSRALLIEPRPEDGPNGSIRLTVRDAESLGSDDPDIDRLWISPERSFLCVQSELSVFGSGEPPAIVSMETCQMESLARSPQGHWYPTRVRRKTSNSAIAQFTDFHLDFDAKIPDELFEPLILVE